MPTAAVQSGQDGQYVFVVKTDQSAELRPVQVGRTTGNETIIDERTATPTKSS